MCALVSVPQRLVSRASFAAIAAACVLASAPTRIVVASLTEFPQDLNGFTAAAKSSAVAVSFDDVATGTNIGGQTIGGATFTAVGSPLMVVAADSTVTSGAYQGPFDSTNKLVATSGANVVSPGGNTLPPGPDANTENDDIQISFAQPVGYFAFDHLSQEDDGTAYTRVGFYDQNGNVLLERSLAIALLSAGEDGAVPGGVDFFGVVSDSNNIAKVIVNERDDNANAPDNNIGYDSLRFGQISGSEPPPPQSIPLPPALAAFPLAAVATAAAIAARHFRRG